MKGTVIALFCAVAFVHAEINENGCPINPALDVLKPHPNCNKFYQCTQGELLERRCASNLVFNVETQQCDFTENVDCENRVPAGPDSSEESGNGGNINPTEICAAPGSHGVLVAHENCNQFYKCRRGRPVAHTCRGKLLFNPANNRCDRPRNVDCGDRNLDGGNNGGDGENGDGGNVDNGDGGNNNPGLAPEICAADGSDGVLVAHENCNQFYECANGVPVALKCASNLQFNASLGECDYPENVECGERNPDGGNNDSGSGESGNGDNSGSEESGSGGNSNPTEICAAPGSHGVLVAHENCNQFYKCIIGRPVAFTCWGRLLFNPAKDKCDRPRNVDCGDRNLDGGNNGGDGENGDGGNVDNGDGGNNNPGLAPEICAADGSDGVLVAHENCNQFYECANGVPVALKCASNLQFNASLGECDYPENVECGERNPDGGNNDSGSGESGNGDNSGSEESGSGGNSNPTEICAAPGSHGVLVAHENCNQFYKCIIGRPVAFTCWGRLLFNPAKDKCDWPRNVNCGDRNLDGGSNGGNGENGDGGNGDNGDGQASEICATKESDGILVAHENCNQFYKCSEGKPVAMDCPLNLLYNPSNQQCDWPENVNCASRNAFRSFNKHLHNVHRI